MARGDGRDERLSRHPDDTVRSDPLPPVDAPDLSATSRRLVSYANERTAAAARRFRDERREAEEERAAIEAELENSDERLAEREREHHEAMLQGDMAELEVKRLPPPKGRAQHAIEVGLILGIEAFACYLGVVIFDREPTWLKIATAISAAYVLNVLGYALVASGSRRFRTLIGVAIAAMVAAFTVLRYLYFDVVSGFLAAGRLPLWLSISLGLITGAVVLAAGWLHREYDAEAPVREIFGREDDASRRRVRAAEALARERALNNDLRVRLARVASRLESLARDFEEEVAEIRWSVRELIERYEVSGIKGVVVPPSTDGGGWRGRRHFASDPRRRGSDDDA